MLLTYRSATTDHWQFTFVEPATCKDIVCAVATSILNVPVVPLLEIAVTDELTFVMLPALFGIFSLKYFNTSK